MSMIPRTRAGAALVAALSIALMLVLAGCGDGDGPSSPSPSASASSPTASASPASDAEAFEQYVTAVNTPMTTSELDAAVNAMNEASEALDPDVPDTWPAYVEAARDYARLLTGYLAELEKIQPPPGMEEAHADLIASTAATIEVLTFIADNVEEGNVTILEGDEPPAEIAEQARSMFTDAAAFEEAVEAEAERLGIKLPADLLLKLPR